MERNVQNLRSAAAPLSAASAARLSVAPMMDCTDRHCRYLHRLVTRNALLYTEMVTAAALVRGGAAHLLAHSPAERPVALQLGGSDPGELAEAARMGQEAGYDEINLNVGCPSSKVQSGEFGAVLMHRPALVAQCCAAMIDAVAVEVTVKCRIGVDRQDPEEALPGFLARIADSGVSRVAVHARMAWLEGLSPKQNRMVPPLDHELVLRMKERFSGLSIAINGGVDTLEQALGFLDRGLDGVMIGRAAYHSPMAVLGQADSRVFADDRPARSAPEVVRAMLPYVECHLAEGGRLHQVARHMLGLFAGRPGARAWRRILSDGATRPGADAGLLEEALERVAAADRARAEAA